MANPVLSIRTSEKTGAPIIRKIVPENRIESDTFGDLIQYLLDTTQDEYNQEPFNERQMRTAQQIRNIYESAINDGGENPFDLFYLNEQGEPVGRVNVNDKVADYTGDMISYRTVQFENGPEQTMPAGDLFLRRRDRGGIETL